MGRKELVRRHVNRIHGRYNAPSSPRRLAPSVELIVRWPRQSARIAARSSRRSDLTEGLAIECNRADRPRGREVQVNGALPSEKASRGMSDGYPANLALCKIHRGRFKIS